MKTYSIVAVIFTAAVPAALGDEAFLSIGGPGASNSPTTEAKFAASDASGSLYLHIDNSTDGLTFVNGVFGASLSSGTPGVVSITGAEVFSPVFDDGTVAESRWIQTTNSDGTAVDGVTADGIDELSGFSLQDPNAAIQSKGLTDPGIQPTNGDPNVDGNGNFVFARIDFDILGEGSTTFSLGQVAGGNFIVESGNDVSSSVALSGTTVNVLTPLAGDANFDGVVDGLDLSALANEFGNAGNWRDGDFNGDGMVDGLDLSTLAGQFGVTGSGSTLQAQTQAVPEPATFALLGIGGGLLALRRRRGA